MGQKPRFRSTIEAGNFYPRGPSVALSPNVGSSAFAQSNQQSNLFLLAADYVTGTTTPITATVGFTVAIAQVIGFPNIPISQGIRGFSPLKTNQSKPVAPTGITTLLYRVFQGNMSCSVGLVVASVQLYGNVLGNNGIIYNGPYLSQGSYKQFGAYLQISLYNPGTSSVANAVVNYSIGADLSAAYPYGS